MAAFSLSVNTLKFIMTYFIDILHYCEMLSASTDTKGPKMKKSFNEIVIEYGKGRLNPRPSFYAGRGNNYSDLNSQLIETVYTGVKTEIGQDAAKAFVQTVGDMTDDASATTFLHAMQDLERNQWAYREKSAPASPADSLARAVADTQRDLGEESAYAVFMGALGNMMGGYNKPKPGEGLMIVREFLNNHKEELGTDTPQNKSGYDYNE
jgi:hypothetical protein